jgi:hypothetical protein
MKKRLRDAPSARRQDASGEKPSAKPGKMIGVAELVVRTIC